MKFTGNVHTSCGPQVWGRIASNDETGTAGSTWRGWRAKLQGSEKVAKFFVVLKRVAIDQRHSSSL
jgi:hypothetical protein